MRLKSLGPSKSEPTEMLIDDEPCAPDLGISIAFLMWVSFVGGGLAVWFGSTLYHFFLDWHCHV